MCKTQQTTVKTSVVFTFSSKNLKQFSEIKDKILPALNKDTKTLFCK